MFCLPTTTLLCQHRASQAKFFVRADVAKMRQTKKGIDCGYPSDAEDSLLAYVA